MSEHIEDGWYDAKAKSWAWKQASTGTWQLEIWFDLSAQGQPVGKLPGWFAVTANTIEKRVEQLTALGYAPVSGDIGQEIGCDESGVCFGGLDANVVRAVVKTEAGLDGEMRTKVDNIVAAKAKGPAQHVDTNALRAFGAQMRGAVMAATQRAKAAGQGGAPSARTAAPQRPAPQQQRPAVQPTRGPMTPSQPLSQRYDYPVSGDEIPF